MGQGSRTRAGRVLRWAAWVVLATTVGGCHRYTPIRTTELPRLNDMMIGASAHEEDLQRPDGTLLDVREGFDVVVVPRDARLAPITIERPVRAFITDDQVLVVQGEDGPPRRFALEDADRVELKQKDGVANAVWGAIITLATAALGFWVVASATPGPG